MPPPNFRRLDYPPQMVPFVDDFLDQYDYNTKATKISPFTLWQNLCCALLDCKFKQPCKYAYVRDLPEKHTDMLIKCMGHRIGVWDLHVYYEMTVKKRRRAAQRPISGAS
jgi:hypothetical protein